MAFAETENGFEGGGEDADLMVRTCVMGGFSESGETRALISSLPEVHEDALTSESAIQRFLGETDAHSARKPKQSPLNHYLYISSRSDNEQISRAASPAGPTSRYTKIL